MENRYVRYALDTALSLVFWVPIIGLWSYSVVKLNGLELLTVMAGSVVINASLGGIYGRLLNKWRKVFNYY